MEQDSLKNTNQGENASERSFTQTPANKQNEPSQSQMPQFNEPPIESDEDKRGINKNIVVLAVIILVVAGVIYIRQKSPENNQASLPAESGEEEQNGKENSEEDNGNEAAGEKMPFSETGQPGTFGVYFSKNGEQDCGRVYHAERVLPEGAEKISKSLMFLFAGPTPAEKERGYSSFFSADTAYSLLRVTIKDNNAYVNLADIRNKIPNASSSCGSTSLIAQIENTVRNAINVDNVLIAINGSPETFYEWLQRGCPAENCSKEAFLSREAYVKGVPSVGEKGCVSQCGDDVCQEVVCLADGCPCAETPATCELDCRE